MLFTSVLDTLKSSQAFLNAAVNNKITIASPTSTTETYTFSEGGVPSIVITITYTDATKETISTVERTT